MTRYRGRHTAVWLANAQGPAGRKVTPVHPRVRRGMGATAVAALAMAALTASQAPGMPAPQPAADEDAPAGASQPDGTPGDGAYHTELPPLDSPTPAAPSATPRHSREGEGASGIPATVLAAYRKAESAIGKGDPGCGLPWELLAAIGKVESGQARGGAVDANGTTLKPILGPVLNGSGFADITDTDQGVFDGDTVHDRAVGPMQFIPGTWNKWGSDGNGDGRRDPNNVYDAALAAGHYLCAGPRDLRVKAGLDAAILSYNHSDDYLRTVLSWLEFYRKGVHQVPDGHGVLPTSPGAGGAGEHDGGSSSRHSKPPQSHTDHEHGTEPSEHPSDSPSPDPTQTGPTSDPTQTGPTSDPPQTTPPAVVPQTLARVGNEALTAQQGKEFTEPPVRVVLTGDDDKVMAGRNVTFTLGGDTGSTFAGGKTTVTAATDEQGVATAPTLHAGGTSGVLTVHAAVEGHPKVATDVTAKVVDPRADKLVRADDDAEYTAQAGQAFASQVKVKATWQGTVAEGVQVTVTILDAEGEPVTEHGPCFPAAQDTTAPRYSLTAVTGEDGVLTLPELTAGDTAGTYTVRLTTADTGDTPVDIPLTVTPPDGATGTPAP